MASILVPNLVRLPGSGHSQHRAQSDIPARTPRSDRPLTTGITPSNPRPLRPCSSQFTTNGTGARARARGGRVGTKTRPPSPSLDSRLPVWSIGTGVVHLANRTWNGKVVDPVGRCTALIRTSICPRHSRPSPRQSWPVADHSRRCNDREPGPRTDRAQ